MIHDDDDNDEYENKLKKTPLDTKLSYKVHRNDFRKTKLSEIDYY
jgi:hypothetical protein